MHNLSTELESLRIQRRPNAKPWRKRVAYVALLIMIPGAFRLYLISKRAAAREIETVHPTLQTLAVGRGAPILTASGYLVARRKAVVSAKIQGRLAELNVEEGSRVWEGQVIARLDNADYEAQVDVARAQVQRGQADLAEQERELRLTQRLAQAGVVSKDQFEAAESRVRAAEASLAQSRANFALSEANLENTSIRAPFSGVVVKKMAEVGESVAPIPPGVNLSTSSGAIVSMADMATLEAEADVSQSNIAKLQRNQPAQVSLDAIPDHTYRALLRQVIPTADRTKATIMVKVRLLEKDADLRPEMSAKVTFLEREAESSRTAMPIITVPKDAVVAKNGTTAVFVVDEQKKVHLVPVSIRPERQDEVIVDQGLAGTEALVLHPPSNLKDGDTVRPRFGESNG